MSEENKALIRRFYDEVFNRGNLAIMDQLMAPDFVDHNAAPGQGPGLAGVREAFAMMRDAFPDMRVTVEGMLAEGDRVVGQITFQGTHRGAFMGIPPTGKAVSVSVIDIIRVAGGKAVERWGVEDNLGMMMQLGVVPPPGQAAGAP